MKTKIQAVYEEAARLRSEAVGKPSLPAEQVLAELRFFIAGLNAVDPDCNVRVEDNPCTLTSGHVGYHSTRSGRRWL